MSGQPYQEVEDRRRTLRLLHAKLKETRDADTTDVELMVCLQGDDVGISHLVVDEPVLVNSIGEELGMSGAHTVALFERIRDRCLIGKLHNPNPNLPVYKAELRNLSDEGKQMIDLLPQDQLIIALREVIETAKDPETPGTEEQKDDTIDWANKGISLARNIEWLADKLTNLT